MVTPVYKNRLLHNLSDAERECVVPHLTWANLRVRAPLETPNTPIDNVFFPETGIVSVVARAKGDTDIEAGVIGFEGMTGLPYLMGDDRWSHSVFVQVSATGWLLPAEQLLACFKTAPGLHVSLLRYLKIFLLQTTHTALANGRANIRQRLARWLLMVQDRLESDDLPLTHEFIAMMLGVRRSGVTDHIQDMERTGLIVATRGEPACPRSRCIGAFGRRLLRRSGERVRSFDPAGDIPEVAADRRYGPADREIWRLIR